MITLYESILSSTKSGLSALPIQFSRVYNSTEFDRLITDYCNYFNIDNSEYIVKVLEDFLDRLKKLDNNATIQFATDKHLLKKIKNVEESDAYKYMSKQKYPVLLKETIGVNTNSPSTLYSYYSRTKYDGKSLRFYTIEQNILQRYNLI